jgi:antitoxin (DNA-binding transcriptional repressor) of toxin-antitoxin stability system
MTITVNIGDAKTRLSELIGRVEAGDDVVIARDNRPVARLSRLRAEGDARAAIEEILAARADQTPTSREEILAWRDEERRYE